MILTDYIEQTSAKKIPTIFGKNVVLVPFYSVIDMDDFVRLHRKDKNGYMGRFSLKNMNDSEAEEYAQRLIDEGQIFVWSVVLEEKRLGFIYLSSVNNHAASINGILDTKTFRDFKGTKFDVTPSVDAAVALIRTCFDNGFIRIEADALADDKKSIAMNKTIGFTQEGLLRKAACVDGECKDVIIFSILKEDIIDG